MPDLLLCKNHLSFPCSFSKRRIFCDSLECPCAKYFAAFCSAEGNIFERSNFLDEAHKSIWKHLGTHWFWGWFEVTHQKPKVLLSLNSTVDFASSPHNLMGFLSFSECFQSFILAVRLVWSHWDPILVEVGCLSSQWVRLKSQIKTAAFSWIIFGTAQKSHRGGITGVYEFWCSAVRREDVKNSLA